MIARIKTYLREIRLEWDKVSKPEWKEVQGNTLVVIVASAILGIFLWMVDGNTRYPKWASEEGFEYGIVLLIALIPLTPLIARRYTPKWKMTIPISFVPLAIVLLLHVISHEPIAGFGMSWLRDLFIR